MAGYVLSPQAEQDLRNIYDYTIKTWGVEQFTAYRELINTALDAIIADPFLVGSKERNDLSANCRLYRVGHHYIAYRQKDKLIEVARVLHERMHFEAQLSDESFPKS